MGSAHRADPDPDPDRIRGPHGQCTPQRTFPRGVRDPRRHLPCLWVGCTVVSRGGERREAFSYQSMTLENSFPLVSPCFFGEYCWEYGQCGPFPSPSTVCSLSYIFSSLIVK